MYCTGSESPGRNGGTNQQEESQEAVREFLFYTSARMADNYLKQIVQVVRPRRTVVYQCEQQYTAVYKTSWLVEKIGSAWVFNTHIFNKWMLLQLFCVLQYHSWKERKVLHSNVVLQDLGSLINTMKLQPPCAQKISKVNGIFALS